MEIKIRCIKNGKWEENCYLVSLNRSAVIIDPGGNADLIADHIREHSLTVEAVINTHAHFDHIGAVAELTNRFHCSFYLHSADKRLLRSANLYMTVFAGEKPVKIPSVDVELDRIPSPLVLGDLSVVVIPTPGHTEGSVCFLIGNHLFTGDTLLKGTIGRVDLPGGNKEKLQASLQVIAELPEEFLFYPGHGEPGILAEELQSNQPLISLLK